MTVASRKTHGSHPTALCCARWTAAEDLLTFITGSVGGRNAIAKLLGKVAKSPNAAEGKMPVVALKCGTYDHADYGTVHYPIFNIIDWAYWDRNDEPQAACTSQWMKRFDRARVEGLDGRESHH